MGQRIPEYRRLAPDGSFVELSGIDVHYRVEGDNGPGVVLLHHTFGNVGTWRHVLDGLSDVARVVAFDRPGFGFTQRPTPGDVDGRDPYTRAASVELAVALMDHLGMRDAVLVGSSAGGTVALETVDRHPDRVRGLVLIGPAITGDVGPPDGLRPLLRPLAGLIGPLVRSRARSITPARVARGWSDPSRVTEADAEAYRAPLRIPGWEAAIWSVINAEPRPDVRPVLPRIGVPTLVVSGAHDRTIRPAWSRRVAAAIPGARYVELPDVGHTPQEENPERLNAELRRFLDELA